MTDTTAASKHKKAVRLVFSYDGDAVSLISQEPVEMVVPPSDPVQGFAGQKGFWAEVKDQQDETLYRRVMHNPMRPDVEVFSDDPQQTVAREPVADKKGVFVVLVPDADEGHEVTLSSSSGAGHGFAANAQQPASEIARFKLNK
jgi:hypothetical protein